MEEERVYTVTIKRRTQFVASEWAKERYKGDSDNLCGGICVDDYTKESEVTSDFAFRKVDAAIEYCNAWKSRFIQKYQEGARKKKRSVKVLEDFSHTEDIDHPDFLSAEWLVELECSSVFGTENIRLVILLGSMAVVDSWPYVMLSHRALYLNSCAWEPEEFETLY